MITPTNTILRVCSLLSNLVTNLKPLHFGLHVVLRPRRLLLALLDARVRLLHGALRVLANVRGAQVHLHLHRTQEAAVDVPDEAADGAVDSLLSVLCLRHYYTRREILNVILKMNVDADGSVAEFVDLLIILLGIDFNCI